MMYNEKRTGNHNLGQTFTAITVVKQLTKDDGIDLVSGV